MLESKPAETVLDKLQDEVLLKFYDQLTSCVSNGIKPFLTTITKFAVKDLRKKTDFFYSPLEIVDYISGKNTLQSLDFLDIKCLLERYQLPTDTDLCTTIEVCVVFFNNHLDQIDQWRHQDKTRNRLCLLLAMVDGQIIVDNNVVLTQEQMAALLGMSRRSYSTYVMRGRAMLKGMNHSR